jgi:hypothetical protein
MAEKPAASRDAQVVRDPNFARYYADNAAAFTVGRDAELVFLLTTPTIESVAGSGETASAEITTGAVHAELCRVRMTHAAATVCAYNLLFALLQEGGLEPEGLRSNVEGMIAFCQAAPEEPSNGR